MSKKTKIHSPTLKTVQMVEDTLKNMEDSVMTIAELKRKLPKKVNHNTLMCILEFLENHHRILVSLKGITYIYEPNPQVWKTASEGLQIA